MFQDCEYKTNVYENFKSHKYRKHSGTGNIFKPGINSVTESFASVASDMSDGERIESNDDLDSAFVDVDPENLEKDIELKPC